MRAIAFALCLLALGSCQCQPAAARFAVTRVTRTESVSQSTTTTTQTFDYLDARLFGGRELEKGALSIDSASGADDHADYSFEYDDDGVLQRWTTSSSNDALDSTVYFRYTDEGRVHMIETDSGPSNVNQINIEANYQDNGQLEYVIWNVGWWIFHSSERATASYDDQGRIEMLDGGRTDVRYDWSDDRLAQVDVLV
ncbi:MAG: hypothetical protein JXR83_15815, partial [Deltaproteobacteria bacterium]|nr:hypothetical protein [Deltaproteobacteria bacterium]